MLATKPSLGPLASSPALFILRERIGSPINSEPTRPIQGSRPATEPLPGRCATEEVEWEGRKVAVVRL